MRAVVAGASGGVGRAIVQRLVKEGVPVVALVRNVPKAVRSIGMNCTFACLSYYQKFCDGSAARLLYPVIALHCQGLTVFNVCERVSGQ